VYDNDLIDGVLQKEWICCTNTDICGLWMHCECLKIQLKWYSFSYVQYHLCLSIIFHCSVAKTLSCTFGSVCIYMQYKFVCSRRYIFFKTSFNFVHSIVYMCVTNTNLTNYTPGRGKTVPHNVKN